MWECGLKHIRALFRNGNLASLPMWECGLKLIYQLSVACAMVVTPHVGVWIET